VKNNNNITINPNNTIHILVIVTNNTRCARVGIVARVCGQVPSSYVPRQDCTCYNRDDIDFFFGFCFFVAVYLYTLLQHTHVRIL